METASELLIQSLRLLEGLERVSTKAERISVLKMSCYAFDHGLVSVHDLEIEAGAAERLCHHLKRAVEDQEGFKEAERICKLLSIAYQCTDEVAVSSFCALGFELIPCIFKLISKHASTGAESSYAERLLFRVSSLDVPLGCVMNNEELLTFLLSRLQASVEGIDVVIKYALSLLAGLASHKDSKELIMKFPGLFGTVVDIAKSNRGVEIRFESARLLSQLAWEVKNRSKMGQTRKCVQALISFSDSSHQHVRFEAYTALKFLSAEADNKLRIVSSGQGKLVKALMREIRPKNDDKVRLQALEIILNLICRETFERIGSHPGLVERLAALCTAKKEPSTLTALPAQSIKRLASYVQVKHKCHVELLQAMIRMSGCNRKAVLMWTAKAFLEQSALSSCSFYVARDPDALNALTRLATCRFSDVKASALEAVVNLTDESSNAKKLASSTKLLEALVDAIESHKGDENSNLRRHSVRAILSLSSHRSSTRRVAKHVGLVSALSRYGISQDEDVELKRAALHGVLLLAPQL